MYNYYENEEWSLAWKKFYLFYNYVCFKQSKRGIKFYDSVYRCGFGWKFDIELYYFACNWDC
jgi:hypothetical protein